MRETKRSEAAAPRTLPARTLPIPSRRPLASAELLRVHRFVGNRLAGRLLQASPGRPPGIHRACSRGIQAKLSISQPDDVYEREADAVADHVVQRLALPAPSASTGGPPELQRECDGCKSAPPAPEELEADKEEEEVDTSATTVSPKAEDGAADTASPPELESSLALSRGEGRPLPGPVRQQMEQGFGQDFSHVRIHTGERSSSMNRSIHARAFTHGRDVFFNRGQFSPTTIAGQTLLAHELTHVVQQTGGRPGAAGVQRAAEAKFGNWAHWKIQDRLRRRDKSLVTEAPIPGGTRDDMQINSVGFADFYKAEPKVISGISGWEPAASKDFQESERFFKYVNMRSDWRDRADSEGPVDHGPRRTRSGGWNFKPNFPTKFWIGELKPLFPFEFPTSLAYHGMGTHQAGNYRQGFEHFVKRVYQDNPDQQARLPASITGAPLVIPDANIPDAIHYARFEQERQNETHRDAIIKADKEPKQRIWMYRLPDGLYVYFLLPLEYRSNQFPAKVEEQLQALDPLLRRLRDARREAMGNTLMQKRDSAPQGAPLPSPPARRATPAIQRKEDWTQLGKAWEDSRKAWVLGTTSGGAKPKDFLKRQAKGILKKAKVDKELKLRPTGKVGEETKTVRQIQFWSSFRGRILGALRFRFGHAFEKVAEFFEKMKAKLRGHHAKSDTLVSKNGIFSGWKKVATRAIIRFAVEIFKEMLAHAFRGFVNCINGIVGAILGKFHYAAEEAKEDLKKEIEPVCCDVMAFKDRVEEEYKQHESTIATFTETIETIQEWRRILDNVETAVRIGVQIVSCGLPPGLGCLWGLVAQLGISAGLSLLARSDYFDEEIAKPAARSLMDVIVGDSLHNFLIQLLENTPLKPFLDEAQECRRRSHAVGRTDIGGNVQKLDPNTPANAAARAEWEKEYGSQILADLQKVFQKGKGKKVTKEDLQKLVEQLGKTPRTPDELKAMFEAARDPATGKLSIEKATGNVEKGEVPEAQAKERDIDYDKATRSNLRFQKILGWDPYTFLPKPGIAAGSTEFADFVYDMQEAMRIEADGILGEETLIAFYDRNKVKKDHAYEEATRIRDEKRAAKDEAAKAKAAKEKAAKGGAAGGAAAGQGDLVAIPITAPEPGMRMVGDDPLYLCTSPGWIGSSPYGTPKPEKTDYAEGERIAVDVVYWYCPELVTSGDGMGHSRRIWFPDIPAEFIRMTDFNGRPQMEFRTRENFYFKMTSDSNTGTVFGKGRHTISLRAGDLP